MPGGVAGAQPIMAAPYAVFCDRLVDIKCYIIYSYLRLFNKG